MASAMAWVRLLLAAYYPIKRFASAAPPLRSQLWSSYGLNQQCMTQFHFSDSVKAAEFLLLSI
jgi:hypothetical protein